MQVGGRSGESGVRAGLATKEGWCKWGEEWWERGESRVSKGNGMKKQQSVRFKLRVSDLS